MFTKEDALRVFHYIRKRYRYLEELYNNQQHINFKIADLIEEIDSHLLEFELDLRYLLEEKMEEKK